MALSRFFGYRSFVRADILSRSETRDELQADWRARGFRPDYDADGLARDGGAPVLAGRVGHARASEASLASWPAGAPPAIVYSDPQYTVLRLSR